MQTSHTLFKVVSLKAQGMHLKFHPNIQGDLMDPYIKTFLPIAVLIELQ
jgi:hypothetical protein